MRDAHQHPAPARTTTVLVLALSALLLFLGIYWYGFSLQTNKRFWTDIADRVHGPMTFRFFLQPTMALIAAIPDGVRDAREGHSSFFWSAWWNGSATTGRLREGLASTARVVLLGLSMDVIYQMKVLDRFYPVEALMMAILLAIIPYFIARYLVEAIVRRWFVRPKA